MEEFLGRNRIRRLAGLCTVGTGGFRYLREDFRSLLAVLKLAQKHSAYGRLGDSSFEITDVQGSVGITLLRLAAFADSWTQQPASEACQCLLHGPRLFVIPRHA